jgi:HAD superfamily hydrolase (TIGR01509 family)
VTNGEGVSGDVPERTDWAGVIFDLDGVIVDTEHFWEEGWVASSDRRGYQWTPEDTSTVQGMSGPEWSRYLAEKTGVPDQAEEILDECVRYMISKVEGGHADLLPGAGELIKAVAGYVPLAVASSAPRPVIDAVLTAHGLSEYFKATCSSAEVPKGKPAPDVYLEAARRLVVDPRRAFGIEDSSNGMRAAHASGLTLVALPNPKYPPKPDALELAAFVAKDHFQARTYLLDQLATSRR